MNEPNPIHRIAPLLLSTAIILGAGCGGETAPKNDSSPASSSPSAASAPSPDAGESESGSASALPPIVFNITAPINDLEGTLAAEVKFAQSQILPARPREGDNQPHLTGRRKTLLLVRPLKSDDSTPMSVLARDGSGKTLGTLALNAPRLLPKTAYYLEGVPEVTDFTPGAGLTTAVPGGDLAKLVTSKAPFWRDCCKTTPWWKSRRPTGVGFVTSICPRTRRWTERWSAPNRRRATNPPFIMTGVGCRSPGGKASSSNAGTADGFARASWTTTPSPMPATPGAASCRRSGLRLASRSSFAGNLKGTLTGLKVGAPTQLLIHTIDVGMLTTPRGKFEFAREPEAHREYFQTVPVSRFIVAPYAPLALSEVMLPTGVLLKELDPSKGGWHNGDMRQHIGKELISHGIDNANYGLHSTAGRGERSHPYVTAQLAAHNTRGRYERRRGAWRLGWQRHRDARQHPRQRVQPRGRTQLRSRAFRGRVQGLGAPQRRPDQFHLGLGRRQEPLPPELLPDPQRQTHRAGQESPSTVRRALLRQGCDGRRRAALGLQPLYLYTPNTAAIIQRFLENKAVFDADSPTGFSKWNADTSRMEPFRHRINLGRETTAPVNDLSAAKLASLLAESDLVKVAMGDGNWTKNIPPASLAGQPRTRLQR